MSHQPPPSYNGTANYASEWAPSYPAMIPPDFTVNSEYTPSSQPPVPRHGYPLDYNLHSVNANAQIAPHGASGQFFPPFPSMPPFDASQLPPFPSLPLAPAGSSPLPMPTGSSVPQYALPSQSTEIAPSQSRGLPGGARATSTYFDPNREEGEVSEREHKKSSRSNRPVASGQRTRRGQPSAEPRVSDREEGEASSTKSSRSSGSRTVHPNTFGFVLMLTSGSIQSTLVRLRRSQSSSYDRIAKSGHAEYDTRRCRFTPQICGTTSGAGAGRIAELGTSQHSLQ